MINCLKAQRAHGELFLHFGSISEQSNRNQSVYRLSSIVRQQLDANTLDFHCISRGFVLPRGRRLAFLSDA